MECLEGTNPKQELFGHDKQVPNSHYYLQEPSNVKKAHWMDNCCTNEGGPPWLNDNSSRMAFTSEERARSDCTVIRQPKGYLD